MSNELTNPDKKRRRIRWSEEEKTALGTRLSEILHSEPYVPPLQAVGRAQEVLEPHRRRHLLAWSTLHNYLRPYMLSPSDVEARLASRRQHQQLTAGGAVPQQLNSGHHPTVSSAAASGLSMILGHRSFGMHGTNGTGASGLSSHHQGLGGNSFASPDSVEAALLNALSQESVISRLAELLAVALVRATEQVAQAATNVVARPNNQPGQSQSPAIFSNRASQSVSPDQMQHHQTNAGVSFSPANVQVNNPLENRTRQTPQPPPSRPKVLIVGVAPNEVSALSEVFRGKIDMRFWRPGDSLEQLRLHAAACSVAVLVEANDPEIESVLRTTKLQIVRHTGGVSRLKERLTEMYENGLFNLLMAPF